MYQHPFSLLLDEYIGLLSFERIVPCSFTCGFHEVICDHRRVAIKLNSRLQLIQARGISALIEDTPRVLYHVSVFYYVPVAAGDCAVSLVDVLPVSAYDGASVGARHFYS